MGDLVEPDNGFDLGEIGGEQIAIPFGDPGCLIATGFGAGNFGQHNGLAGSKFDHFLIGGSENLLEAGPAIIRSHAPVKAVQCGPINVFVSRIGLRNGSALTVIHVWTPDPGDARYIISRKNVVDVPPGLNKLARLIAVGSFRPGGPGAVHLRRQTQEEWMIPPSGISGPARDIIIEFSLDDVFEAIVGLIGELRLWLPGLPGDHRDRAMRAHGIHPGAVEILRPVCSSRLDRGSGWRPSYR